MAEHRELGVDELDEWTFGDYSHDELMACVPWDATLVDGRVEPAFAPDEAVVRELLAQARPGVEIVSIVRSSRQDPYA